MKEAVCRTFSTDTTELRFMTAWFRDVIAKSGLDEEATSKAEVCLNEAAANIMTHAHEGERRHSIRIEIQLENRDLRMTIVDDCRPFNPLDAPPPSRLRSIEDAPVGGLGIGLIRAYARDISYRRERGHNILVLMF